jgi:hypothetical protein
MLQCRVHGIPTPKIIWTKNRKPIEFAGGRYRILSEDKLMISNVKVEDQGYFSCEARNQFGVDVKNTLLTITGLGEIFKGA